ncbi:MAG: hypothetical protein ABIO70_06510 [Pseudomonadota bacterium]
MPADEPVVAVQVVAGSEVVEKRGWRSPWWSGNVLFADNNPETKENALERYIGIDVHAASCTLAVVSERGRLLRTMVVGDTAH